jgi:hypothetical protein
MPTHRSPAVFPSIINLAWTKASADEFVTDAMRLFGCVVASGRCRDSGRTGLDQCRALHQLCVVRNTVGGNVWVNIWSGFVG